MSTPPENQPRPGRLKDFEDAELPDLASILAPVRPIKTRQPANPIREPGDVDELDSDETATADVGSAGASTTPAAPPTKRTRSAAAPKTPTDRPAGKRKSDEAGGQAIRPSSIQVPADLLDVIVTERDRRGRSTGQLLKDAIEASFNELPRLVEAEVGPAPQASVFAPSTARTVRPPTGDRLATLNIRLREQDYQIIDDLVSKLGARSRGHLATIAYRAYLDPHGTTGTA